MSKKGLEKILNFITDICIDKDYDKIIIGKFSKYTIYVLADSEPYFYLEYQADDTFNDIFYRFNLLKTEFDGIGEFNDWDELNNFLLENWGKIIKIYNILNLSDIENKGIIKYN